jgi:hypothetical protein
MGKMSSNELLIAERVISETDLGGTGCGKPVRPVLWGSGKVTSRSSRKIEKTQHFSTKQKP